VRGAQLAHGDLVMFMDADLDVHPRQLAILHRALVDDGADVVIGSKLHRASQIAYPLRRRILSLGYYVLVRTLFRLPVHDTQTGLKLYRREVLERIVPRLLVKRFAHDLEALVNAHRLGFRIVEVPVVVTQERPFPRIGLADALLIVKDTAAIFYRTYLLRYYDRAGS
jgi:glycosyltransferase involved in cell wall biosynthesis